MYARLMGLPRLLSQNADADKYDLLLTCNFKYLSNPKHLSRYCRYVLLTIEFYFFFMGVSIVPTRIRTNNLTFQFILAPIFSLKKVFIWIWIASATYTPGTIDHFFILNEFDS